MKVKIANLIMILCLIAEMALSQTLEIRRVENFNEDWKFHLGDITNGNDPALNDSQWRQLNLPHDWSIEGKFDENNPATVGGGALPGGIGWYRKEFLVPDSYAGKRIFIEFDGVYMNSQVWINGAYLGNRPNGYISFRYELTDYIKYGDKNLIAIKVDNSKQPNSRWYSGSGIYRNVRLVVTNPIYVDQWGTFVTTPFVSDSLSKVNIEITIRNDNDKPASVNIKTVIYDAEMRQIAVAESETKTIASGVTKFAQNFHLHNPQLWSLRNPYLYMAHTTIYENGRTVDDYITPFGIRTISFDAARGFYLNGEKIKIKGVCNHHDLGALGAAVNKSAIERQLEILKRMGVNAIRTSHNPPAQELLDLCDSMGFLVMDEAFDIWKKKKTEYDYALYWDEWHKKDIEDMIMRDRNHPSIILWSIGNEVIEQWDKDDSLGVKITKELTSIVKSIDSTRPVTAACNNTSPDNPLFESGALDLIGFNYHHEEYPDFPKKFPGKKFIATETNSALATRGHYDMPSDSIRIWPERWDKPFYDGNPDNTCSSYDNCRAPWGSTHLDTWKTVKKYDFISGMFIWTGFDYLGEPTPYGWPSRSSYFGLIDLAGFPKDSYYFYQSQWTENKMLHLFPHWNWKEGDNVDVLSYTNLSEVELFLNGHSIGKKFISDENLRLIWSIKFKQGTLKAIGASEGTVVVKKNYTADKPYKLRLEADRNVIRADGTDLSFITVKVLNINGNLVPNADCLIQFEIDGPGRIVGVDNGLQTSHEPFKANYRKTFNGLCLVIIQSDKNYGEIKLKAEAENLIPSEIIIYTK
ncbi:beta-galactosidase GalB [Melioribacter sp. OK-6-Me]|uniref:beta-galactosidase GalB n=1 Tax=unclassified Melioribacter TaxID=2627329 RepID=UPI003EDAA01A